MTSSKATVEPALVTDPSVENTPETVGGAAADPSPFQLLPVGEAFGVCDLDGECR